MFLPGTELGMAEAYLYNDIDIEGSVEAFFSLADGLVANISSLKQKIKLVNLLRQLPKPPEHGMLKRGPAKLTGKEHSYDRDRQAVDYHYSISNDFFALYLDPNMVYTCGYFLTREDPLEKAQIQKLDYVCNKLRLRPGQRILDIGCGWGGLAVYAAQTYGVDVTGITLSQPQADFANQRIAELGLSDRCRVLIQDYRQVPEDRPFDALVSVGMFEQVGAALLKTYFEKACRLVKPHGVFLNHGISTTFLGKLIGRGSFSDVYVFPDGELVPIQDTIKIAEQAGFETRDLESLREHYILTLRHWVKRLEANHDRALQYVDETTYRVWRLYMSGSIQGFKTGRLNIYQALFVKPDGHGQTGLPLTRTDWYQSQDQPVGSNP